MEQGRRSLGAPDAPPEFEFRGSLGAERRGPDGFIDYLRAIHAALADYACIIDDLIATGDRAAARMTFQGIHRGLLLGAPATGRKIRWAGGAFFHFDGERIVKLWVLGDIDSVRQQIGAIYNIKSGLLERIK